MNRGSPGTQGSLMTARSGFNEAPIHESGKYHIVSFRVRTPSASMRPRFMNRGSAWPRMATQTAPSSFNEAPIHESGKSACAERLDSDGYSLQ